MSKRKCEVCGEKVSTNGGAWTSHMRKHVADGSVEEVPVRGGLHKFRVKPEREVLTCEQVEAMLPSHLCATVPGKSEDGALVHLHYVAFRPPTPKQVEEARLAEQLGQPRNQYTGKLDRVWKTKAGELIVTMLVMVQRAKKYRSFNISKGRVYALRVIE
jgi:hypothetical protein